MSDSFAWVRPSLAGNAALFPAVGILCAYTEYRPIWKSRLKANLPQDSFVTLRDTVRWRVALVLAVLIMLLMATLGLVNQSLGLADTQWLAWICFAVSAACVMGLLILSRRIGAIIFFVTIGALLILVPSYGYYYGRNMQHWAYVLPPLLIFVLRPGPALAAMLVYGVYVSWITALLLPVIDVIRFASGYGVTVCFMYTYALLQEQAASMLRYHSDHDALSNCLNRRTFNEAIARLTSHPSRVISCDFLLLDIDHFKAINDQHGHLVGDRIITQVAAELGRVLASDAPLHRYGGEEFAVMLIDAPENVAMPMAESLRAAIEQADFQGVKVTISVGVARWRASDGKPETALQRADDALYHAKRSGRNRVVGEDAISHRR